MIRVGCCGYPVARLKYRKIFNIVELNSTFYEYPQPSTVKKWREEAPEDFDFTVKAHQDISHKSRLKLESARDSVERMKEICQALNAKILLIQTPASFKPDNLREAERFFEGTSRNGLTLVWETRGPLWEKTETRANLREVLERLDVPHVTDPSRTMPVFTGHTAYFRLHGLGEQLYYYQYTDEELAMLCNRVKPFDIPNKEVYVLFNNLAMFDDAKRLVTFLEDGRFPSITGATGIESVKRVIEKRKYPLTKSALIKSLGWRLVELESGKQIRLSEVLKDLSSKSYRNPEEMLKEMRLS